MTKKKTIFISLGLLIGSILIAMLFFWTAPEAEMEGASKTTAMLVDVVQAEQGDFTPTIVATGIVQPATDISLSNQVGGEITRIANQFLPGAYVKKGDLLLQINPADFENTLLLRKSDLSLAQSDYEVELGRQDVALKDYELIGDELTSENQNLVLRKPQLLAAKANVEAAEAAVSQASLNLNRASIRAPFDAHILSRNVNLGSQITQGSDLGRLVGIDEYWVMANIPLSKVNWLSIGEDAEGTGSPVKIVHPAAWEPGQFREGRVSRLVGALDNQTRLARVIIRIADPLLRRKPNPDKPPLIIGTFVEVQIEARELKDVTRLERQYIRPGNTVWVIQEGKLNIRKVNILFEDQDFAYINEGLSANEQVVATDLATVVDGSPLRLDADK
ncbi:efflux RND transporter periplasmic adaptor subunit [Cyclobacterium qasimii]|uniref:RND efflux system, membrane fusion protein CmeA n=2 Tax=Cyclobacterium qasimii TaxID=1350429 RepID=S7WPC8_9BACT|nr:efflux RND transporter periplasmic adaptor subunit [Cyclobacterium qasimii]EPR66008.1 RND efflux system, membrane fusion protein CmeA [Cyclobacterium qasimii M12-11B]GEO20071.1 hemolysin D [Cyclobacterium qasimii]